MRVVTACASTWSLWRVCLADCDYTHVEKETASCSSLCAPSNNGAHLYVRTRLCPHTWLLPLQAISTQPTQSFPQVWLPKPSLQQPAPNYTGGCGSQSGEHRVAAQVTYADLSPLFFQNGCWEILWVSEASPPSCLIPLLVRVVPRVGEAFLLYSSLSGGNVLFWFLSCSLSLFYFVLPSYVEIHLALSESLGLLAVFSRYFVRSAPHVDIFWYICGRRWVPHPSTPLFW